MKIVNIVLVLVLIVGLVCSSSKVVELKDGNFEMTSEGTWIVAFYGADCDTCKALMPSFTRASNYYKGKVRFGKIDGSKVTGKVQTLRFDIMSYPTFIAIKDNQYQVIEDASEEGLNINLVRATLSKSSGFKPLPDAPNALFLATKDLMMPFYKKYLLAVLLVSLGFLPTFIVTFTAKKVLFGQSKKAKTA